MKIYIPSLGRPHKQITWNELQGVKGLKKGDVQVVINRDEVDAYCNPGNEGLVVLCPPPSVRGIGKVRQWLLEYHAKTNSDQRMVMMDDDLTFSTRRTDDPTKATPATKDDIGRMLKCMEGMLKYNLHGSIVAREGANRFADQGMLENTRLLRVLGYRAADVLALGVRFNRLPVMEDFDATLQLLRLGKPNFAICEWWQNQAGSGLDGGCSTYRDMEMQAAGAHGLKKLHPEFVTVVEKTTKGAWGGGTRTDVKIAWKKAFASAGRAK
jgi:hypothetical protein